MGGAGFESRCSGWSHPAARRRISSASRSCRSMGCAPRSTFSGSVAGSRLARTRAMWRLRSCAGRRDSACTSSSPTRAIRRTIRSAGHVTATLESARAASASRSCSCSGCARALGSVLGGPLPPGQRATGFLGKKSEVVAGDFYSQACLARRPFASSCALVLRDHHEPNGRRAGVLHERAAANRGVPAGQDQAAARDCSAQLRETRPSTTHSPSHGASEYHFLRKAPSRCRRSRPSRRRRP